MSPLVCPMQQLWANFRLLVSLYSMPYFLFFDLSTSPGSPSSVSVLHCSSLSLEGEMRWSRGKAFLSLCLSPMQAAILSGILTGLFLQAEPGNSCPLVLCNSWPQPLGLAIPLLEKYSFIVAVLMDNLPIVDSQYFPFSLS